MKEDIHKQVRSTYGEIARQGGCGCGIGCCNTGKTVSRSASTSATRKATSKRYGR